MSYFRRFEYNTIEIWMSHRINKSEAFVWPSKIEVLDGQFFTVVRAKMSFLGHYLMSISQFFFEIFIKLGQKIFRVFYSLVFGL